MTSEKSVVLITGASRGIGRTMVEVLTANGHSVVAVARPSSDLDDLCRATGAIPVAVDVSDLAAVSDAVANVEATFGPVSLLVNNAGIAGQSEPTWLHDADAWWRVFEVNVKGVFACSRAVLPSMLARREGRIINVSSGAAHFPISDDFNSMISSAYLASKAAVNRFSEALAVEVRPRGVKVFAISPGSVKTEMTENIFASQWDDPDFWTPPEACAQLAMYLNSGVLDELSGRYITAATDDWRSLNERAREVQAEDLLAMRLRPLP